MAEDVETTNSETKSANIDPEVASLLKQGISVIETLGKEYLETQKKSIEVSKDVELRKYKYWTITVSVVSVLAIILIGGILYLANGKILSSEGVSFLLGTIAGYLFSVFGGLISGTLKLKEPEP